MPRFRPTARLLVLDPADRVLFSAVDRLAFGHYRVPLVSG